MSDRRFVTAPPMPETWRGAAAYRDGLAKFKAGDFDGAFQAFAEAVGREEFEANSDDERPFVAAALINTGSTLDELGHFEAAVRSYDLAVERIASDESFLVRNEWLRESLESVKTRRDWLLEHRLDGERGPYYLIHVDGDPDSQWQPLYLDGCAPFEVGDVLSVNDGRWRVTRIEPGADQSGGPAGRIHVVPVEDD